MGYCSLITGVPLKFKNIGVINILVRLVHFCHAAGHRSSVQKVVKWPLSSRQRKYGIAPTMQGLCAAQKGEEPEDLHTLNCVL